MSAGASPFPWQDAMALGLCRLRLAPDLFWSLTPRELMIIAGLTATESSSLDRAGLQALMRRVGEDG